MRHILWHGFWNARAKRRESKDRAGDIAHREREERIMEHTEQTMGEKTRGKMRRTDRELMPDEAEKILRENQYGILSTVCPDGYPYGLPVSYAYEEGKLYFHHTSAEGLLGQNIAGEVKACFTVVGATELLPEKFSTKYESVIAFGTIRESEDKIDGLMKLVKKLSPDFVEQGRKYAEAAAGRVKVYELQIERLTGKARKDQ